MEKYIGTVFGEMVFLNVGCDCLSNQQNFIKDYKSMKIIKY